MCGEIAAPLEWSAVSRYIGLGRSMIDYWSGVRHGW